MVVFSIYIQDFSELSLMNKLLTIAIPTFNRADLLRINLNSLLSQASSSNYRDRIEILIIDNHSDDATLETIQSFDSINVDLRVISNSVNIGSDRNIAKCYVEAAGDFVLILGDDDFVRDSALDIMCEILLKELPDILYLKTCGYISSQNEILMPVNAKYVRYFDLNKFLLNVNVGLTCISSVVFNKSKFNLIPDIFIGTNLVQFGLALKTLEQGSLFIATNTYFIAYKRNNSGGYNFWSVFVDKFFGVYDSVLKDRVNLRDSLAFKLLLFHYPYYILNAKKNMQFGSREIVEHFDPQFNRIFIYQYILRPLFLLPYSFFIFLSPIVFAARAFNGEFRKILVYLVGKIKNA